jgi:hypothetical protein
MFLFLTKVSRGERNGAATQRIADLRVIIFHAKAQRLIAKGAKKERTKVDFVFLCYFLITGFPTFQNDNINIILSLRSLFFSLCAFA